MNLDSISVESVHKHGNKELGQYQAILTENILLITQKRRVYALNSIYSASYS